MRARIPATVFGLAALCAVALASSIPAVAQGTPEQRSACEGDAQRLCGHCIPDIDCITSCMVQRQRLVSAGWRAVMRRGAQAKRARD
jgi:hypothetical protein